MVSNINFMDYFREVANSAKFQISATLSFGCALYLIWFSASDLLKVTVTVLFLFPVSMLFITLVEKGVFKIYQRYNRSKQWNNLTPEESEVVFHYIRNNTKTKYVIMHNGTYRDSGIINPLIDKGILYIASDMTEYRGNDFLNMEQCLPFNIHDNAFEFFKKKKGG